MEYLKEPCTALFVGQTGCGKTEKAMQLLEGAYKNFFDYIVIISPTLKYNDAYIRRPWFWKDLFVVKIEPRRQLYDKIDRLGQALAGHKTLFLIDDIIADEALDKRRNPLLDLATSGRHRQHSLWLLTQSYTSISNYIRFQWTSTKKMM